MRTPCQFLLWATTSPGHGFQGSVVIPKEEVYTGALGPPLLLQPAFRATQGNVDIAQETPTSQFLFQG